jgi:hypothetical protein
MVVVNDPMLTFVVAFVSFGRYFRNRSRPSESNTSSRGSDWSSAVGMFITEESMVRNCPAPFARLKISA